MDTNITFFAVSCIINSSFSLILGVLVLIKKLKSRSNQLWFLTSLATSLWSISLYRIILSSTENEAIFWNRLLYLGAALIPIFFLNFVCAFLEIEKNKKILIYIGYIISLIWLFLIPTRSIISGAIPLSGFPFWIKIGQFYLLFVLTYIFLITCSLYFLYKGLKNEKGIKRSQIKYLLIAAIFGFGGGITDFFPQLINVYPYGNYFIVFYVIIIAYAITRYRLMDIRIAFKKTLDYLVTGAFLCIVIFLFLYLQKIYSSTQLKFDNFIVSFLAVIIITSLLFFLQNLLKKAIQEHIYEDLYSSHKNINEVSRQISSISDFASIINLIASSLRANLKVDKVAIVIADEKQKKFVLALNRGFINVDLENIINNVLAPIHSDMIIKEELERTNAEAFSDLSATGIEIILPLKIGDIDVGLIILGNKVNDLYYTKEEFELLHELSMKAAIAIQNAKIYDKIEKIIDSTK